MSGLEPSLFLQYLRPLGLLQEYDHTLHSAHKTTAAQHTVKHIQCMAHLLVCQPFVRLCRPAIDRAVAQAGVVRVRPHAAGAHTVLQTPLPTVLGTRATAHALVIERALGWRPGRHLLKNSSQRFRGFPSGAGHPARAVEWITTGPRDGRLPSAGCAPSARTGRSVGERRLQEAGSPRD